MNDNFNLITGMKVLCVDDWFNPSVSDWGDQLPQDGGIYTVCKVIACRDAYTGKDDIGLQFEELRNDGDRLAFSVWRFKPLDNGGTAVLVTDDAEDAHMRRIKELEEQNKAQFWEIRWLREMIIGAREQAESDAAEEAKAKCAHEWHRLEKANRELDAENELIARERDALQRKVVELENLLGRDKGFVG